MTSGRRWSWLWGACLLLQTCGGTSNPCTSTQDAPSVANPPTGSNVMTVTVNGSLCYSSQYQNEPCASVTICQPGSSTCQTIDGILVDTGSYGLRLFSSVVTLSLTKENTTAPRILMECVTYGDGSSQWGYVVTADVKLGTEKASNVPVMIVDSTFGTPAAPCTSTQSTPQTSPSQAHYNGILGIGVQQYDCVKCETSTSPGMYYDCDSSGNSCSAITVAAANQVQNPVALMPTDNNGVMITLPAIPSSDNCGAASATGYMVLGVDTAGGNNSSTGLTAYPTDSNGYIKTTFTDYSASAINSFIDSGSNELFLPAAPSNAPDCNSSYGSSYSGQLCPSSSTSYSATNAGTSGSPSGAVSFSLYNAYDLLNSGNRVFYNLGGTLSGTSFDWGLPFFFGRTVAIGINAKTSSNLGTGPYFGY